MIKIVRKNKNIKGIFQFPMLVRFYPGKLPNSEFAAGSSQYGSTDKMIDDNAKDLDEHLKDLKDRKTALLSLEKLGDYANSELHKCKTKEELIEKKDKLIGVEVANVSKYLEEIRQRNTEVIDKVRNSDAYPENVIKSLEEQAQKQLLDVTEEEGKALIDKKNAIEGCFNDVKIIKEFSDTESECEMSSVASFGSDESNKQLSDKDNKEDLEKSDNKNNKGEDTSDKQSPLDYVLEKQSCEPSSLGELDGEE
jgi:hypothetical protein